LLQRFGMTRADLSGATLAGEIPLPNAAVNRFIAEQLARRDAPVTSIEVDAQGGDSFTAHVVTKARFVPPVRVLARVERQPEWPADPVLWLRWSIPAVGPLAIFAAPALTAFKALPPGVKADGERIGIDLREMLVSRGLGELAGYLRAVRLRTRPGAFIVQFDARAPD
jgi:hypothetical protein